MAGFKSIREYTDFPSGGGGYAGLACDRRFACVSVRKLQSMDETADALGIRKVMSMKNLRDEETGFELAFISWQEGGTGDAYLSAAILFGTYVGNGAGLPGARLDNAGCLIQTL